MKTHVSIAAALVLIASAPTTWAQQQGRLTFEYLDTNKDGSLSVDEVATLAARIPSNPKPEELFARWDADKDGKVSKQEFDARPRNAGGQQSPAR
jgi:Ca2+-binding EF-hand superfamily protein